MVKNKISKRNQLTYVPDFQDNIFCTKLLYFGTLFHKWHILILKILVISSFLNNFWHFQSNFFQNKLTSSTRFVLKVRTSLTANITSKVGLPHCIIVSAALRHKSTCISEGLLGKAQWPIYWMCTNFLIFSHLFLV